MGAGSEPQAVHSANTRRCAMKGRNLLAGLVGALAALFCDFEVEEAEAALTTNSWFLFSGKWEDGSKWSAGVPAANNAVNTITNDLSSITVTVDGTTVLSNNLNNCMTVSNLVVGRGSVITHTLLFDHAVSTTNVFMTILNSFTLNATGSLAISNSFLRVPS